MALRPAVHSAATLRFYGHSRSLHPPPSRRPARDDFALIMDELDFVKAQLARLPTRRDQAFVPLKVMFGSAVIGAALVILWLEAFWRHYL